MRFLSIVFFVYFLVFNSYLQAASLRLGLDHGELSYKHLQIAENFIEREFKKNGIYDPEQIRSFLEKLKREKEEVIKSVYETKLLEHIELNMKKYKKAEKKAEEEATIKKSQILRGYEQYLIPKIENLLLATEEGQDSKTLDAISQDFIRGYVSYYTPNAHVTPWPRDLDLGHNIQKTFRSYKFQEKERKIPPASNLCVGENNKKEIEKCLGYEVLSNHFLNPEELEKLRECSFDISLLSPSVSSLWKEVSEEGLKKFRGEPEGFYPEEGESVWFDKVILRGHQSPKVKVIFKKNNKEYKLKLKMGYEVHSDLAVTKIAELVGLNQDSMKYYKSIKMHLGDTTYTEFSTRLANKYGVESVVRYITAYGEDEKGTWVILHDVALESRNNGEFRVGPMDISSWDLTNRREYRSLLLFWGWMNLQNAKPSNFKLAFAETENGLVPLHRFHDYGTSLGTSFSLKNLNNILTLLECENADTFPASFLGYDKRKDKYKLIWNDMSQFARYFKNTTWDDLKWMARNILKINPDDLYYALTVSGMPIPAAKLYLHKLLLKRNEMIKYFKLSSEFKEDLIVPLKKFNVYDETGKAIIEKGKLKQIVYEDKNNVPVAREKWITFLNRVMAFDIPIFSWAVHPDTKTKVSLGPKGITGLKASMGVVDPHRAPYALTTLPVGVGVEATLSRSVLTNEQLLNNNDMMHIYKVMDSITFRFGLDSPLLRKLISESNIASLDAGLKFYEYEFTFTHYADTIKKAYLSPFDMPKILANPLKYAAEKLKPIEMISSYQRVGLEVEGDLRVYSTSPGVKNQIALTFGAASSKRKYILRDQFGQLHIYKDSLKESYIGFAFGLAEIDLFFIELPFFRIEMTAHHFKTKMSDYILPLPVHDRRLANEQLNSERRAQEYKILKSFEKQKKGEPLPEGMQVYYALEAEGSSSSFGLGALFAFNRLMKKEEARAKVLLPDGTTNEFYRKSFVYSKSFGIDPLELPLLDIFVAKRKKIQAVLESNLEKPEDTVIAFRIQDYYRVQNREKLYTLIADLNRRYSKSSEKLFYRNFEIPDKKLVDKFRKVYGLTKIYIDLKDFKKALINKTDEDLKLALKNHFWNDQYTMLGKKPEKPGRRERLDLKFNSWRVLKQIQKIKEQAEALPGENKTSHFSAYMKMFRRLRIEDFGVHFFREILDKKDILVFGEISGVVPSYSTMQDLQALQRRRFTARHWGHMNKFMPIQKYLRYKRLLPILIPIEKNISDRSIFGELETALAPNLESLFHNDTSF